MRVRQWSSHSVSWNRFLTGAAGSLLLACSAGGEDQRVLAVDPGNDGSPSAPRGGSSNTDPNPAITDVPDLGIGDPGESPPAQGCQQAQREFTPKIPTVYLLVDRSASMFDVIPETGLDSWTSLRGGVLQVMQELQAGVRFGFAAFSGQVDGTGCLMDVPSVAPGLNNYDAIATLYNPLGKPANTANKETPTTLALNEVAAQLRADTSEGEKYILFVTDGEPDYCNDGNPLCPPDSVVGLLQNLAAGTDGSGTASYPPITTLVFGIESPNVSILPSVLQGFANAGGGQPVAPMVPNANQAYDPFAVYDQCAQIPGWAADFAGTGKLAARGATIGTYTGDPTVGGSAPVFRPDPTDQAALADEFRTALASVKSCTFDLGEDGVKVDLTRSDLGEKASVIVNGAPAPFDPANGWRMLTETTVQLEGMTCEAWRDPLIETSISFDFPCDVFVPR